MSVSDPLSAHPSPARLSRTLAVLLGLTVVFALAAEGPGLGLDARLTIALAACAGLAKAHLILADFLALSGRGGALTGFTIAVGVVIAPIALLSMLVLP